MLVDRVLRDLDIPDPDDRGGNPLRGSRLGRCARQSAYMLFPEMYPPEPLPARTKLVFRFGDMIHEMVRAQFRRVVPGSWGMEEERFHFKVPLTIHEAGASLRLFETGALQGVVHGRGSFVASVLSADPAPSPTHKRGLWLDLAEPALYVPLHVDGIADAGKYGLAPVEIKSMTTAGFRHALAGKVDYAYRVQMAVAVDGTQTDAVMYVAVRKDTCHLLEVVYSRKVDTVRVEFTKQGQALQVFDVREGDDEATPMDDWEAALVEHPFEPDLLDEASARVKRILLSTPTNLPAREHGPNFDCETCEATGVQTKVKSTGLPLKKGPKPCTDCEKGPVPVGEEVIGEVGAPTGQRAEAELVWQCRYCPFLAHCWGEAKPRIVFDREAKPHFWVTRKAFQESGIQHEGRK